MKLTKLVLHNFRTYVKETIVFSPTVTIFVGNNAIGKTNILEAIFMASTGKSFRAVRDSDMITWGSDIARLNAQVGVHPNDTALEIVLTSGMVNGQKSQIKKYLVNNVARRQIDFVGNLRSVLFSPTDLELVTDSPSIRRDYLNTVLMQVDREYRRNLQSYERGLRQRNSLLDAINEGKASRSQLLFWNQLLIKTGTYITRKREQFITCINRFILDDLSYRLIYDPSIISTPRLEQYSEQEIAAKSTLVGPQRDDFCFELRKQTTTSQSSMLPKHDDNFVDVARFGSRGEQRLAVLWLKLAELAYIESEIQERPVLLLDDIFSELDETSRKLVIDIIHKQQTIITTAEDEVCELFAHIHDVAIVKLPYKK